MYVKRRRGERNKMNSENNDVTILTRVNHERQCTKTVKYV